MSNDRRKRRPAHSEDGREKQLVSLAIDLAEKQLIEGTASSQVITHYLKLGSTREKLEQDRLRNENELLKSKVDQLASAKKVEELYAAALDAMRAYTGQEPEQEDDEVYYDEDVY
jgi:hypothetical protein